MPHQQLVADVAGEIDPATGVFAYREIILSFMRQTGKTSTVLPPELDRCLMPRRPQRVVYTAQTGGYAREKLLDEQLPLIEASVFVRQIHKVQRAKGEEAIRFLGGSAIVLQSSARAAGHGPICDMGVLDETWEDEDDRREQSLLPGMNTRPWAQMWNLSTMGTDRSVYFNRKVELGRHMAEEDSGHGIAYFEWSVPKDADVDDPAVWYAYMPALGWTIGQAAIFHSRKTMTDAEFRRAQCNQAAIPDQARAIPAILWDAVQDEEAEVPRKGHRVCFGLDVAPDRESMAIVASDGTVVEVTDHDKGTGWAVDRVRNLKQRYRGSVVVVDGQGPAVSVADELERKRIKVIRWSTTEVVAACAAFYDAIADQKCRIRKDPSLDLAVEGLAKRPLGDRFMWSRQASTSDASPIMAASLALKAGMDNLGGTPFSESGGLWTLDL